MTRAKIFIHLLSTQLQSYELNVKLNDLSAHLIRNEFSKIKRI